MRKRGFNLAELTVMITVIAVVVLVAIPKVFHATRDDMATRLSATLNSLNGTMDVAEAEIGLLPMTFGPAEVLTDIGNLRPLAAAPANCAVEPGEQTVALTSGVVIAGLNDNWDTSKDYNTQVAGDQPGDMVCVALNGLNSAPEEIRYVPLMRHGDHVGEVMMDAPVLADASGVGNNPTVSHALALGTVDPVDPGVDNSQTDYNPTSTPPIVRIIEQAGALGWLNGSSHAHGNILFHNHGMWWNQLIQFVGHENWGDAFQLSMSEGREHFVLFDSAGTSIVNMTSLEFVMALMDSEGNAIQQSSVFGHTVYDTLLALRNDYIASGTPVYMEHDGYTYEITEAAWFSPVKVSLNGNDAKLNSDNHFLFALQGFEPAMVASTSTAMPTDNVITTTGGLNPGEAWLAVDRQGDGFFHNGALDGTDVFGDHQGQFTSGYEDLAALYADQLKQDVDGQYYLELTEATAELKLITRTGEIIPASRVLKRIYVDYIQVSEFDTHQKNWIGQRAKVVYKDGQVATSADQWFQSR